MGGVAIIDLFCGVGGMTHGFYKEGLTVVAGIDNDPSCKYAYEKNNKSIFIHNDIKKINGSELNSLYGDSLIKVLIGCAPCQPFSTYSKNKNKDEKWRLLYEFARLIKEVKPDIISMENVPQLVKHKVFEDFVKDLQALEYKVSWKITFCPSYGIPQNRKRLVLLASRLGAIDILPETHSPEDYPTVRTTIGHLKKIKAGDIDKSDIMHSTRALSEINFDRIKSTPEGGSWKNWKSSLVADCHRKLKGKTFGSVYGRMRWDAPSPTITTQFYGYGSGRFGHPDQHRALSYREGALIQTFPENYKFVDPSKKFSGAAIGRHIGNAVPVELGRIIAKSIKVHISRYH